MCENKADGEGFQNFKFRFCSIVLLLNLCLNHVDTTPVIDNNNTEGLELVLKPPIVENSLMPDSDKPNSIGTTKQVRGNVETIVSEKNDYFSYSVSGIINVADSGSAVTVLPKRDEYTTTTSADSSDFVNDYILQFSANGFNSCMLEGLKEHKLKWAYANGTLVAENSTKKREDTSNVFMDASYRSNATDDTLASEITFHKRSHNIIAFSAAYDGLTYVPYKTLFKIRKSLKFLMLRGNNFSSYREEADSIRNELLIAWATFPELPLLNELDISNCMIEHISTYAFKNITNLTALYLSHNKILRISSEAFASVPKLRYLDLSHLNALELEFSLPLATAEQILNLLVGVKIEQHCFKDLSHLEYLDLSYTKITRNSAVAFTFMGESIKYISLCYTAIPMIGSSMFKNTSLRGLDLSGNSYAAYTLNEDSFSSVAKSLEFLFFEKSNLKDLEWLKKLQNLVVLNFFSNNINSLSVGTFEGLTNLQVLDLSSNHIGNWYTRIFTNNPKLKILNLRDNNINILTSEMLIDFQKLDYLGIGDNNFVCDCVLRDLVDIATANNKKADCVNNVFTNTQGMIQESFNALQYSSNIRDYDFAAFCGYSAVLRKYLPMLRKSYQNMRKQMDFYNIFNLRVVTNYYKVLGYNSCPNPNQIIIYDKINGSTLKFQLLDYEDEHYWCFNETEKLNFFELNCEARNFHDAIASEIQHVTKYVVISASTIIIVTTAAFVIYLKRWHIHYYYSSMKSAALLAVAAKENSDKLGELLESDTNLVYDLFISYCQSDREWVLEELMPNIEIAGDMSICMHERDFQVGIAILDNIISCMDRSRCLLLVISSNFLLSHWCQFEMRLAQHRMFEASKEHLILVFLEDIPKRKRPKTLQYLMDVKTYIKWPSGASQSAIWDEKKIFWKRLRKSIKNICWNGTSNI